MKKFLALLLVMMLVLTGFTACGSKAEDETADSGVNNEQNADAGSEEGETAEGEDEAADSEEGEDAEKEEESEEESKEEESEPADEKKEEPKQEETKKEESKPAADDKKEESKKEEKPAADKKEENKKEESKPAADKKEEDKKEEPKKEESKPAAPSASVSGTPAEIIDKIYANHAALELPLGTMEIDLADPDFLKMFTGLSSADKITAAAASESMMGSQAYSLVVVKVKDAKDASAVATEMMNGIDQRKWICVEADDLRVSASGDVVVLIMVGSAHADAVTASSITDAFAAVAGSLDLNMTK